MKTQFTYLLCMVLCLILSCSRKDDGDDDLNSSFQSSLSALRGAPDAESRTQIYNGWDAGNKYRLWKEHFSSWNDSAAGHPEKRQLLVSLTRLLDPSIFVTGSKKQAAFLNYELPVWLTTARSVFSQRELFDLTMENKYGTQAAVTGKATATVGCFCHTGNSGYSCKKWAFGFPSGVSVTYGICERPSACNTSSLGCGALWLESCNGGHCNF